MRPGDNAKSLIPKGLPIMSREELSSMIGEGFEGLSTDEVQTRLRDASLTIGSMLGDIHEMEMEVNRRARADDEALRNLVSIICDLFETARSEFDYVTQLRKGNRRMMRWYRRLDRRR